MHKKLGFYFLISAISILYSLPLFATDFQEICHYPQSSKWVESLDFTYKGMNSYGVNMWHESQGNTLKEAYEQTNGANIAVASLGVIYENNNEILYVNDVIDFPFYFLSGWDSKRLGVKKRLFEKKVRFLNDKFENKNYCFIGKASNKIKSRSDYLKYLINIYDGSDTKIDRIDKKNLSEYEYCLKDGVYLEKTHEFFSRFYDSEQAIYIKIVSFLDNVPNISKHLPLNSKIHRFILNIASYKDMCLDCSDTSYVCVKEDKVFASTSTLRDYFSAKGFLIEDGCKTLVLVSSQSQSVDTRINWKSRGEFTNYHDAYKDIDFPPLGLGEKIIYNPLNIQSLDYFVKQRKN